jgi:aspartate kinase
VQKYGGSSVADAEASSGWPEAHRRDEEGRATTVVVIVSAMGDTTDELLDLAGLRSPEPAGPRTRHAAHRRGADERGGPRDGDRDLGYTARSFTGSQAGVITTEKHGDARIIDITPGRIESALEEGSTSSSWPGSRASRRPPRTSPRSVAARPTPPPWRSPPR